jgi:replicative DNA helicase
MNLTEVEFQLLGTYSSSPDLFQDVEHLVSEHIFSAGINRTIYNIIKTNHSKGITTDFALLYDALIKLGYSNKQAVDSGSKVVYDGNTARSPVPKVQILFDNLIRKSLLPILADAHQNFNSDLGDVHEVLDKLRNKITDIDAVINNVSKERDIKTLFGETVKEIEVAMNAKSELTGYTTGITKLDEMTSGICAGVTVIGAVPGASKTTMLIHLIKTNSIDKEVPMIFFSLEMPATRIVKHLIANDLNINTGALRIGDIDNDKLNQINFSSNKYNSNLIIDDTPGITWQYIESKIKKVRKKVPISKTIVVMIDYIQLMENSADEIKGRTDEALISLRCRKIQNMWKKYNIAFIELSQLSREVGKRNPPRPIISDLKESGAIEANADQVWLLYRPDYYSKNPTDGSGKDLRGLVEIGVVKNRYGRTGAEYARFIPAYARFQNYDDSMPADTSDDAF